MSVANFQDYVATNYNDEVRCGENEIYSLLQKSQNKVISWIDNSCGCECNYSIIEEAIYILTYDTLRFRGSENDSVITNQKLSQQNAYEFLNNHNCIGF